MCFFSAWDFHLPPEGGCQLIEFNDNGSGFLFAAIINDLYRTVANLEQDQSIVPPAEFAAFNERIGNLVEQEARSFFENGPDGLFLILDDTEIIATRQIPHRTQVAPRPLASKRLAGRGRKSSGNPMGRSATAFRGAARLVHYQPLDRFLLAG